ncbi:MAG: hypothetical protein KGM24_00260, partial [Elusimicrobia bacterium]|nr:hypothetical protein [Elusimicrobiota bacterium]
MSRRRLPLLYTGAAAAAIAALHALAAYGHPFAAASDEAFYARLALAVGRGSFALPGPFGGPVTDPLPGYPLLLAVPAALAAPHWSRLWPLGLAATLGAAFLTWRLARRALTPAAAAAAALLVGLSPALVSAAGVLMPDAAYAALGAGAFLLADGDDGGAGRFWALAALAGLAALLRPEGVLLGLSLALALSLSRGPRAGAALAAAALLPLAAWLARNVLVAGSVTGYASHWVQQAARA